MSISPFLSVKQSCKDTLQWTKKQLSLGNLRAVQTFDLNTAKVGMHNCTCPHHGTAECDCQMVVMLVYGNTNDPVTLILHGNDGQTWVSIGETPLFNSDAVLVRTIRRALEGKVSTPTAD